MMEIRMPISWLGRLAQVFSSNAKTWARRPSHVLPFLSFSVPRIPDQCPSQPLVQRHLWLVREVCPSLLKHGAPAVGVVDEVVLVLARLRHNLSAVAEQLMTQRDDLLAQVAHADLGDLGADVVALAAVALDQHLDV